MTIRYQREQAKQLSDADLARELRHVLKRVREEPISALDDHFVLEAIRRLGAKP